MHPFETSDASALNGFLTAPVAETSKQGIILQAQYNVEAFHLGLYDACDIALPLKIERAIAKRQAEYLAGRLVAKYAQQALGFEARNVALGDNRAPKWPAGLTGSISHARGYCACLALSGALNHPGIDIETIATPRALAAIEKTALSASERAIVNVATKEMNHNAMASLCFSAKESLFKALFPTVQKHFGFAAAELRTPPNDGRLSLFLTQNLHPGLPAGRRFDLNYRVTSTTVLTWLIHKPDP